MGHDEFVFLYELCLFDAAVCGLLGDKLGDAGGFAHLFDEAVDGLVFYVRQVVVVFFQDLLELGFAGDADFGAGFLLGDVDEGDFLGLDGGHHLAGVVGVRDFLDPVFLFGVDVFFLDIVVVGDALGGPDADHEDVADFFGGGFEMAEVGLHHGVELLFGEVDVVHFHADAAELGVLVDGVGVDAVGFGRGHDGFEFLYDLAGGVDVVAAFVEVGLEVVVEREVDVFEVVGLFALGLVGFELLEAGFDGLHGAKAVGSAAVGEAGAVADLLLKVVDVFVDGDALFFLFGFLGCFLGFFLLFLDRGVHDHVDGLFHFFLGGGFVSVKEGVEGEFEAVQFAPEFGVLVVVGVHGRGGFLRLVPGGDFHFEAGGHLVVDFVEAGLETDVEGCVTFGLLGSDFEKCRHDANVL